MGRSEQGSSDGLNTFDDMGYRDPLFETDDAKRVRYEQRERTGTPHRLWSDRSQQWLSSDTAMEIER